MKAKIKEFAFIAAACGVGVVVAAPLVQKIWSMFKPKVA